MNYNPFLGLGHETVVCVVCLFVFLSKHVFKRNKKNIAKGIGFRDVHFLFIYINTKYPYMPKVVSAIPTCRKPTQMHRSTHVNDPHLDFNMTIEYEISFIILTPNLLYGVMDYCRVHCIARKYGRADYILWSRCRFYRLVLTSKLHSNSFQITQKVAHLFLRSIRWLFCDEYSVEHEHIHDTSIEFCVFLPYHHIKTPICFFIFIFEYRYFHLHTNCY